MKKFNSVFIISTAQTGCFLITLFFSSWLYAQQQTLCQQFGDLTVDQSLGSNVGVPNTSSLGSGISDKTLLVDGTFTITQNFTFTNCNIKFTTGSSIVVSHGLNPSQKRSLVLNNSRLFSCSSLWVGINMGMNTRLETKGLTQIEDAEKAVIAHRCVELSIQNTTFNRNWIGISLRNYSDCGPIIQKLQTSYFFCTSNLNMNSLGARAYAGIVTRNVPIVASAPIGAINVQMSDLRFGILDESSDNFVLPIVIDGFRFNAMREDGIQVKRGSLTLRNCNFFNCEARGIDATTIHKLLFTGGAITYTMGLPLPGPFWLDRVGIFVSSFAANAVMTVSGGTQITSDHGDVGNKVTGFWLNGNTVGAGTLVDIISCNFNLKGGVFTAILINGTFPSSSKVNIFNNSFMLEALGASVDADGIKVQNGEKNNIHIYSNPLFDGQDGGGRADTGIELNGSTGAGNYVKDNVFPFNPNQLSFRDENAANAITATDFENTLYCTNQTGDCAVHFNMTGANPGTQILNNTMRGGSQTILLNQNSFIGVQGAANINTNIASANQWYRKHPQVVATAWAECDQSNDCNASRFIVHTQPTVVDYFTPSFHPSNNVYPPTWVVFNDQGIPFECTIDGLPGPDGDDDVKRKIADGIFSLNSTAQTWGLRRNLYQRLQSDGLLLASYSGYGAFLANMATGSVGKFWAVNQKIGEALATDQATLGAIKQTMALAQSIESQLIEVDSQLQISAGSAEETLSAQKSGLSRQLYQTDSLLGVQQAAYRVLVAVKLGEALTMNSAVTATQVYEQNEKTVNDIWLQSKLYQQDEVTDSQLALLIPIAMQCPFTGGQAVYRARGMMPPAEQAKYSNEELGCKVTERFDQEGKVAPPLSHSMPALFPNPATDEVSLILPESCSATARLFSLTGQMLVTVNCQPGQNLIHVGSLMPGMYIYQVVFESGDTVTQKLSIIR